MINAMHERLGNVATGWGIERVKIPRKLISNKQLHIQISNIQVPNTFKIFQFSHNTWYFVFDHYEVPHLHSGCSSSACYRSSYGFTNRGGRIPCDWGARPRKQQGLGQRLGWSPRMGPQQEPMRGQALLPILQISLRFEPLYRHVASRCYFHAFMQVPVSVSKLLGIYIADKRIGMATLVFGTKPLKAGLRTQTNLPDAVSDISMGFSAWKYTY